MLAPAERGKRRPQKEKRLTPGGSERETTGGKEGRIPGLMARV